MTAARIPLARDIPPALAVGGAAVAWLVAWFANLPLGNWLAFDVLGLEPGSQLGEAVAFFVYDVPVAGILGVGLLFNAPGL